MNAQQLKNAILQEAIEGRLVPQDPNDEPASALLARIRKEKERLYKNGLLKKKEVTDRDIIEDEVPFTIPKGWVWTKIDNVAFVTKLAGFEYTKYIADNLVPKENGIPLFKGKNVQNGRIVYEFEAYIPIELSNELKRSQIKKKCLLTPYVGTIGNIGIHDKDGIYHLGSNVGKIEFYNEESINVIEEYAKYYLMSSYGYDELTKFKKATAQESISIEAIRDVFIPLPPIAEQQRIVAKIEELLPKVEEYGKAQNALNKLNAELPERLKKSILQEAIEGRLVPQDPNDEPASVLLAKIRKEKEQLVKAGKLKKKDLIETPISEDEIPFEIPESWEWVRVKVIGSKIVDGDHNPPKGLSSDSGYYMLSSKNINNNGITELDSVRYLSYEDWRKCNERTNLQKGDVLLTTVGTLGRSCVYEGDKPYCFQRSVSIIQTFVFNYYLKYCFDSPFFQSSIDDKATGTAQRGFYLNQLEDAIIPLPPLAEQHRIVEKLEQLLGEIEQMNK